MKVARLIAAVLSTALVLAAAPAAWGQQEGCQTLGSRLVTVAGSPGSYVGNTYGDLVGAVSLQTVSRIPDGDTVVSIVALRYVERSSRSSFEALLTVVERPTAQISATSFTATGRITTGRGRFAAVEGSVELDGAATPRELEARMLVNLCR